MTVRILTGDCRSVLKTLPDESVHCVVTSPPYFNLRDYQTATWEGGELGCDHVEMAIGMSDKNTLGPDGYLPPTNAANVGRARQFRSTCGKCGAHRIDSQIGLEESPEAYIAEMVAVFRDVRRVLRSDGVAFVNLGDSYAGSWDAQSREELPDGISCNQVASHPKRKNTGTIRGSLGLKPKDLMMMPARVAIALHADGWWLRSDIIWAKPNPMPESVTDRPTSAHEHVFLLAKSASYFFDADAVREPYNEASIGRFAYAMQASTSPGRHKPDNKDERFKEKHIRGPNDAGRNIRNVWTIATSPFPEAHFATFPPALVEPCIKAGTSEKGCCAKCGAPWTREVERTDTPRADFKGSRFDAGKTGARDGGDRTQAGERFASVVTGWSPSCKCEISGNELWAADRNGAYPAVPCTVLDPFGGAGTVGLVADRLGRDCILIELNPDYAAMARKRIAGDSPLFAEVA